MATVLVNARVLTLDPERPRARVLRFEGGRVTHVADDARGLDGEVRDLGGAVVLPGLSDAHLHIQGIGARALQLDLRGCQSSEDAAVAVGARHAELHAGAWLLGRGWDQNRWPGAEYPTRDALDRAAPGRPVALTRIDGHALWASSRALELAGIRRDTADPAGGSIVRDARGEPTGLLVDTAMELVEEKIPAPSRAELRAELLAGVEALARAGLGSVHDMGTTPEMAEVLAELAADGALGVRVFAHLYGKPEAIAERMASPTRVGLYREVGVKLFADGALGSHGALLSCPYCDRPSERGLALMEPHELTEAARRIHEAGLQIAIHAIGDLANRRALDAIAAAQGSDRSRRHRVEHAQILAPEDLPRFRELGVTASMQPTHATSDMPWAEARLGRERLLGAYAWRSLARSGARLAFGSDAPIEHENPWFGLHAAVTRQDRQGAPERGWLAEQCLSVPEALEAFVCGAASAVLQDDPRLRPGARADLCVVDRDPLETAPSDLWRTETLATWVDGRERYAKR